MANEIIGTRITPCQDCGEKASIMQARRKGAHLYTRCKCGLDQRTGSAWQNRLWADAEWIGEPPAPPVCVDSSVADFDPNQKPKIKLKPRREAKTKSNAELIGGTVLLIVTIGGAAWASMKK